MEAITKENFISRLKDIRKMNFQPDMQTLHEFVMESTENGVNWNAYDEPDVKSVIDTYFGRLNALLNSDDAPATKTEVKEPDKKKVHKSETEKPATSRVTSKEEREIRRSRHSEVEETDFELTERIPDEIKFIRRYVSMYGKKKTKHDLLLFINALHRAMVEKRIRKGSAYAKQILYIQDKLVKTFNTMNKVVIMPITEKIVSEFKEIIASEKVYPSVMLLKRYLSLNGKYGVKDKAKLLMDAMTKAFSKGLITKSDKYYRVFDRMHETLKQYVKNKKQKILSIHQAELSGLNGLVGDVEETVSGAEEPANLDGISAEVDKSQGGKIMSLTDARNAKFDTLGLTGGYLHLIGEACKPTHLFVYGDGGSGKSSFLLKYAEFLNHLGNKILYIAGEQYNTPTFTDLVKRLNIIGNQNFVIVKEINVLNPGDFDFVALDSKDSLGVGVEDFRELKKAYPNQSFLVSSQGTKSGDFTGSGQWRNEVDTMIYCEAGIAKTDNDKNRWGGKGEMRIFDDNVQKAA